MSTLTINIPEDRWARLNEISDQFGISPEELVRISVDDLLTRPQEDCQQAIEYIFNKNENLYRRLS
ncbi:MAG: DNA-binding protein [Chloroflexi bacterium]|nr:DNA-binding protein [Chloroflexota bacterium]